MDPRSCAAAAAEDPAKPIFLLTHHPFPNTVWYSGSNSWDGQFDENANTAQSGAFYQELCEKYPQIIHFSGHTHIPMADPRSIYQDDGFTLIQTATFANNFWMENDGHDETGSAGGTRTPAGTRINANSWKSTGDQLRVRIPTRLPQRMRPRRTVGHRAVEGNDRLSLHARSMAARSKPPLVLDGAEVAVIEESVTANGASFSVRPPGCARRKRARRRHRHFVSRGSRLGRSA